MEDQTLLHQATAFVTTTTLGKRGVTTSVKFYAAHLEVDEPIALIKKVTKKSSHEILF